MLALERELFNSRYEYRKLFDAMQAPSSREVFGYQIRSTLAGCEKVQAIKLFGPPNADEMSNAVK